MDDFEELIGRTIYPYDETNGHWYDDIYTETVSLEYDIEDMFEDFYDIDELRDEYENMYPADEEDKDEIEDAFYEWLEGETCWDRDSVEFGRGLTIICEFTYTMDKDYILRSIDDINARVLLGDDATHVNYADKEIDYGDVEEIIEFIRDIIDEEE